MLTALKRYSLQLIFTLSLLLGLQLPHFLNQYEARLQGHLQEAKLQLAQFQSLADIYFDGDLNALINKHRNSSVALFRDEAAIIEQSSLRVLYLEQKVKNISLPLWQRLLLLSKELKQPIFSETWLNYQANIVLNHHAIMVGIVVALILTVLAECLLFLCKGCFYYCRNKVATSKAQAQ